MNRKTNEASYEAFRREINDTIPPDMAQLAQTRGPDPVGDDVRAVVRFMGFVMFAALAVWAVL